MSYNERPDIVGSMRNARKQYYDATATDISSVRGTRGSDSAVLGSRSVHFAAPSAVLPSADSEVTNSASNYFYDGSYPTAAHSQPLQQYSPAAGGTANPITSSSSSPLCYQCQPILQRVQDGLLVVERRFLDEIQELRAALAASDAERQQLLVISDEAEDESTALRKTIIRLQVELAAAEEERDRVSSEVHLTAQESQWRGNRLNSETEIQFELNKGHLLSLEAAERKAVIATELSYRFLLRCGQAEQKSAMAAKKSLTSQQLCTTIARVAFKNISKLQSTHNSQGPHHSSASQHHKAILAWLKLRAKGSTGAAIYMAGADGNEDNEGVAALDRLAVSDADTYLEENDDYASMDEVLEGLFGRPSPSAIAGSSPQPKEAATSLRQREVEASLRAQLQVAMIRSNKTGLTELALAESEARHTVATQEAAGYARMLSDWAAVSIRRWLLQAATAAKPSASSTSQQPIVALPSPIGTPPPGALSLNGSQLDSSTAGAANGNTQRELTLLRRLLMEAKEEAFGARKELVQATNEREELHKQLEDYKDELLRAGRGGGTAAAAAAPTPKVTESSPQQVPSQSANDVELRIAQALLKEKEKSLADIGAKWEEERLEGAKLRVKVGVLEAERERREREWEREKETMSLQSTADHPLPADAPNQMAEMKSMLQQLLSASDQQHTMLASTIGRCEFVGDSAVRADKGDGEHELATLGRDHHQPTAAHHPSELLEERLDELHRWLSVPQPAAATVAASGEGPTFIAELVKVLKASSMADDRGMLTMSLPPVGAGPLSNDQFALPPSSVATPSGIPLNPSASHPLSAHNQQRRQSSFSATSATPPLTPVMRSTGEAAEVQTAKPDSSSAAHVASNTHQLITKMASKDLPAIRLAMRNLFYASGHHQTAVSQEIAAIREQLNDVSGQLAAAFGGGAVNGSVLSNHPPQPQHHPATTNGSLPYFSGTPPAVTYGRSGMAMHRMMGNAGPPQQLPEGAIQRQASNTNSNFDVSATSGVGSFAVAEASPQTPSAHALGGRQTPITGEGDYPRSDSASLLFGSQHHYPNGSHSHSNSASHHQHVQPAGPANNQNTVLVPLINTTQITHGQPSHTLSTAPMNLSAFDDGSDMVGPVLSGKATMMMSSSSVMHAANINPQMNDTMTDTSQSGVGGGANNTSERALPPRLGGAAEQSLAVPNRTPSFLGMPAMAGLRMGGDTSGALAPAGSNTSQNTSVIMGGGGLLTSVDEPLTGGMPVMPGGHGTGTNPQSFNINSSMVTPRGMGPMDLQNAATANARRSSLQPEGAAAAHGTNDSSYHDDHMLNSYISFTPRPEQTPPRAATGSGVGSLYFGMAGGGQVPPLTPMDISMQNTDTHDTEGTDRGSMLSQGGGDIIIGGNAPAYHPSKGGGNQQQPAVVLSLGTRLMPPQSTGPQVAHPLHNKDQKTVVSQPATAALPSASAPLATSSTARPAPAVPALVTPTSAGTVTSTATKSKWDDSDEDEEAEEKTPAAPMANTKQSPPQTAATKPMPQTPQQQPQPAATKPSSVQSSAPAKPSVPAPAVSAKPAAMAKGYDDSTEEEDSTDTDGEIDGLLQQVVGSFRVPPPKGSAASTPNTKAHQQQQQQAAAPKASQPTSKQQTAGVPLLPLVPSPKAKQPPPKASSAKGPAGGHHPAADNPYDDSTGSSSGDDGSNFYANVNSMTSGSQLQSPESGHASGVGHVRGMLSRSGSLTRGGGNGSGGTATFTAITSDAASQHQEISHNQAHQQYPPPTATTGGHHAASSNNGGSTKLSNSSQGAVAAGSGTKVASQTQQAKHAPAPTPKVPAPSIKDILEATPFDDSDEEYN